MAGPPFDPNTAAFARLMAERQYELGRGWPMVFVAFAAVVAVSLAASAGGDRPVAPAPPVTVSGR